MYQKKLDEDIRCPLEYGISLIGGKWKSRILCLIGSMGSMHFGEFKTDLINISDGVLASTLNELIKSGLIRKNSSAEMSSTEYVLTPDGESLIPLLHDLCIWSAPKYKHNGGNVMGHCRQCEFYRRWSERMHEEKSSE